MRSDGRLSRTRATTHKPRRAYYVFRYLTRQLTPGKPQMLSNARVKAALGFGSEGEISQIMRWLSGEAPTTGRWAYGALNQPQLYRFIVRERMPSGGYLITLLATPEPIDTPIPAAPEIVQLSFLDDPSVIPPVAQQDAARGGSFPDRQTKAPDRPLCERMNRRSARDQHEDMLEESNSSSVGAPPKYDWSQITIGDGAFLPIAALEKAGVTPQIFQDAERKIATRCEYDRPAQIRILIHSLLTHQPIYSASEIAARSEEQRSERPSERAARASRADHGADRPRRSDRRENCQRPRAAAQRFTRESYRRGADA